VATALRQQEELAGLVGAERLVVKTAVLDEVADGWSVADLRRAERHHRGLIRIGPDGLRLTRALPLPAD
jgi:hypothetical protein